MLKISKNSIIVIIKYVIIYGLSHWIQALGIMEHNKAFLLIDLIRIGIIILISALLVLFLGETFADFVGFSLARNLNNIILLLVMLFGSFVASKLFGANFYIAYEILALCQILYFEIDD